MYTEFGKGQDDMGPKTKTHNHGVDMPVGNYHSHANDRGIEPVGIHPLEKKITPEETDALLDGLDSLTPVKTYGGEIPGSLPPPQPPPGWRPENREFENYINDLNQDILKGCDEILDGDLLMFDFTDSQKQHITISAVTSGYIISVISGTGKMYWNGSSWKKDKIILPYSQIRANAGK